MITLEEFLNMPAPEVAELICASGKQVCIFPINNTRRWFALEHGHETFDDPLQSYMEITARAHIHIYRLMFDHGLDTLITPIFGGELFRRGDAYMQKIGADGLARLATHPDFLDFYKAYDIRVHFYGDHRRELKDTPFAYLSDLFDAATAQTSSHTSRRLFFGVFATDATDAVAEFSVRFHAQHGRVPTKTEIIEMYYGEPIDPATMFISSDKFWVFDYPLLSSGEEDLYYMAAPCLYLTSNQLKHILYDHLFARSIDHPDYGEMAPEGFMFMKKFYSENREKTFGIGKMVDSVWYPLHAESGSG